MRTRLLLLALAPLALPWAAPQERAEPSDGVVLVSTRSALSRYAGSEAAGTARALDELVRSGHPRIQAAQQMVVGPDKLLYVSNYFSDVEVFDLDGEHVRTVARPPGVANPSWLAFEGDVLRVSWAVPGRVTRIAVLEGDALLEDLLRRPDGLRRPHTVFERPDGSMLLSELGQLSLFDPRGEFLRDLHTGVGRVLGIARLDEGRLLVTSFDGPPRVLDEETEELSAFTTGRTGRGGDGFLIREDRVLLTYNLTREVLEYGLDGTYRGVFADASSGLDRPNGLLWLPR